jgi:SAM-dependent methyltransferase
MGLYSGHVLPRIINKACALPAAVPHRRRACSGLVGEVLEIGFGSGLNVPYYPAEVTRVAAVEPSDLAWQLAQERVAGSDIPVERCGSDAQLLPFGDDSFDSALSTWTLCTIPDVAAALRELRRVLRPGGTLHFIDHGLAPDHNVQRMQRRIEPLNKLLFGGCHLTRSITDLVIEAGLEITHVDRFYEEGAPKFAGADSLGVAVKRAVG